MISLKESLFLQKNYHFECSQTDTPGPGSYVKPADVKEQLKKPSDSKKGFGGFASSSSRNGLKINNLNTPGAGAYEISKETTILTNRKDFSNGYSSGFAKPIATAMAAEKENEQPAPNAYDLEKSKKYIFKNNNVSADHAFKSQTKREFLHVDKTVELVAPNSYNVKDDFRHDSTKIPYSSFKSNTQRHTFTPNSNLPGPNHYRPYEPLNENIERQLFP
jgi:hypothetical protein